MMMSMFSMVPLFPTLPVTMDLLLALFLWQILGFGPNY